MGAYGGQNIVGPCLAGGSWCWALWRWWWGYAGCVWHHGTGGYGGTGWLVFVCDGVGRSSAPHRWVACGFWLCWSVVMVELVGMAVVLGHWGAGDGAGGGVLVLAMVPRSPALRERWPLCSVDL